MPNNCLSVLYKRIIQVENKNVGLKVCVGGGGHKHTIAPPPNQKSGGGGTCPPCPPASYASDMHAQITAFVTFTPYRFHSAPPTLTWQSYDLLCHL